MKEFPWILRFVMYLFGAAVSPPLRPTCVGHLCGSLLQTGELYHHFSGLTTESKIFLCIISNRQRLNASRSTFRAPQKMSDHYITGSGHSLYRSDWVYSLTMTKRGSEQKSVWPVEIIRSKKRQKTVSASLKSGVLVVRAPARMSDAELVPIIENLQKRLERKVKPAPRSDDQLEKLAQLLNKSYFQGELRWQSIRYVNNQAKRFGSCTPSRGTIRLSRRLAAMPDWVLKYVMVHELAHLKEANHGPGFWRLVNRYPLTERARGYLMAIGLEEDSDDFQ